MGNCDCSEGAQIGYPNNEFASRSMANPWQTSLPFSIQAKPIASIPTTDPQPIPQPQPAGQSTPPPSLLHPQSLRKTSQPQPPTPTQSPALTARSSVRSDIAPTAQLLPPPLGEAVLATLRDLDDLSYTEVERGQYVKCFKFFDTENIYEGETVVKGASFMPHGRGRLYYANGPLFIGTFVNGKAQGRGRLISQTGSYYQGNIKDNKMEGMGKYKDRKGMYEGELSSGLPHGEGIYKTDKMTFQGKFQKGQKVNGTLTWGDNGQYVYTGPLVNELFQGKGLLVTAAGTYFGKFAKGMKQGFGVYTWADGKKFQGMYHQDKKQGYGQYYDIDGTPIYKGQWQADKPFGKGIEFKRTDGNKVTLHRIESRPDL